MMQNEDPLKKIVGDPNDEAPEAVYRLVANLIVTTIADNVIESIADEHFKKFLKKNKQIGQFIVGFVLAAVLELLPLHGLDDQRKRLSYNLRVQSYEEIGELGWSFISAEALQPLIKLIRDEAGEFFNSVKGKEEGKKDVEVEVEAE